MTLLLTLALGTCASLYAGRENLETANAALTCFEKARDDSRAKDPDAYRVATEFALQTTIWIYTQSPVERREPYADRGLALAGDATTLFPKRGLGPYWAGVFRVMKCRLSDTGAIPTCFLKYKKSVLALLRSAREIEPGVHGYGPSRILGVIYREMPKITGGDKGLARDFTEEAVKGSSSFSTNLLEHAKYFMAVKDRGAAKSTLADFIARDCAALDATRVPECRQEQSEAKDLLAKTSRIRMTHD